VGPQRLWADPTAPSSTPDGLYASLFAHILLCRSYTPVVMILVPNTLKTKYRVDNNKSVTRAGCQKSPPPTRVHFILINAQQQSKKMNKTHNSADDFRVYTQRNHSTIKIKATCHGQCTYNTCKKIINRGLD